MLRKAVYSGGFYDHDENRLLADFRQWFTRAELPETQGKTIGVISPHAGYMYSGSCASYAYKLLAQGDFETAIIIHPSHRGNHFQYSVSPYDEYVTPLGNLMLDTELADKIKEIGAEEIDPLYHQNEHSMEVQLPFLKYIKPDCKIVPVMMGNQTMETAKLLAENITRVWDDKLVVIVSTDLSHYHDATLAQKMDTCFAEDWLQADEARLYEDIQSGKCEACGFGGVLTLMMAAKKLLSNQFIKLHYTHSGFTSGDMNQVVGYLSAAVTKGK